MSGIMSMFSNLLNPNPAAPVAKPGTATGVGQPGNIPPGTPTAGDVKAGPNGDIPPGTDTTIVKEPAPFEPFKDLWKDTPPDPNAPIKDNTVFGTLDPKKFMEAAGRIDFSKAVTPEQLTAISAGGEGAVKAFAEAMNKVAQGVYAQSAFATTKIVEQALAKSKETFLADLPSHIKRQTVTDSLRAENPIFSNPAVAPIISALEAQMTVKYPNATAPEITAMAKQYVEALGSSFVKKEKVNEVKGNKGETDWSTFLESTTK